MSIPTTQMFLINGSGGAAGLERTRGTMSARLAALPTAPFTLFGWAVGIYGGTLGTLRTRHSMWLFGGGNLGFLCSDDATTNEEYRLSTDGSGGAQVVFQSTISKSAFGLKQREWHNLIIAIDDVDVRWYINGAILGAPVLTGMFPFSGIADYWLGNEDDNTVPWNGAVGHSAIFDAKKDAAWAAANWNVIQGAGVPGGVADPDLVASWIFDGDLTDISGNGQPLVSGGAAATGLATLPIIVDTGGGALANEFESLPAPAGDGAGAGVDTSTMGGERTITVQEPFRGTVSIEFSNESINGPWAQLATFNNTGKKTVTIAAQFMRVTRSNVPNVNPGAPVVQIASNDAGGVYFDLPATAADGTGASVDVSTQGTFKTVACLEPFEGTVVIEISEDNVTWAECMTFVTPGYQSKRFIAQFMRATRKNVPLINPGLPNIDVGAIADT